MTSRRARVLAVIFTLAAGCVPIDRGPRRTAPIAQKEVEQVAEIKPAYEVVSLNPGPRQLVVQIVVPAGSTKAQIEDWHPELVAKYGKRKRWVIYNYYDGEYRTSKMIANCTNDGVGWFGQGFAEPDAGEKSP